MSWKFIAACVEGTSHEASNTPCQDSAFVTDIEDQSGNHYLIAVVADGAGSALKGGTGAELACETVAGILCAQIEASATESLDTDLAHRALHAVRAAIESRANADLHAVKDYACTLVGCVVGSTSALAFQVGDGVLVFRDAGSLVPVFWPESGEYANMTYFVTDVTAFDNLQVEVRAAPTEVSLMTDGLQRLALVFSTKSVHAGFFEPMFKLLQAAPGEACDALSTQLSDYLKSEAINSRTDDDKTLLLATRLES